MKRIVLISCVSKKLTTIAKAYEMYISPLFKLSWIYARRLTPDAMFILSAKYGLLEPGQEIDPCEVTLKKMSSHELRNWAELVLDQLGNYSEFEQDHFIFLAGTLGFTSVEQANIVPRHVVKIIRT